MKQTASTLTLTGLAGAVAFAGASQAYGDIVSLTLPTDIGGYGPSATATREYWDANTGASSQYTARPTPVPSYDLEFLYENSNTVSLLVSEISGNDAKGEGTANYYYAGNGQFFAYSIGKGQTIGTAGNYNYFAQSPKYFSILSEVYNGTDAAIVPSNTDSYVGFQFLSTTDDKLHNAWLLVDTVPYTNAANPGGLEFLAGAYNTVPDGTAAGLIAAGAVPEPGTLAFLAAGAAGLAGVGLQRRRRAARTAAQA